jgi:hypothetical protein
MTKPGYSAITHWDRLPARKHQFVGVRTEEPRIDFHDDRLGFAAPLLYAWLLQYLRGVPLGVSPIHPERSDSDSSDRLVAADALLLRQEPDEEEGEEEDEGGHKKDDDDEDEDDAGWSQRSLISWVKDEA